MISVDGVLRAAAAGVAATVPMSAVMLVAQRSGLMGEHPPERFTEAALGTLGVHPGSEVAENALAGVAHLAVGAGAGAAYGVVRPLLPDGLHPALAGVGFGLAVWGIAYAGVAPWLSMMPPPSDDEPGRPTTMIAAHVVYGAVLGLVSGRP